MAAKNKKGKKSISSDEQSQTKISNDVGNYETHPFFIKKVNQAKEFLQKFGLPQEQAVKKS